MSLMLPYRFNRFYRQKLDGKSDSNPELSGVTLALSKNIVSTYLNGGIGSNRVVSFDVGTGKSLFIISLIQYLKTTNKLTDGGIVIFLSRIEEIESFIALSGLEDHEFAIYSGNESLSGMGLGDLSINDAPVLFVTQQKLQADREKKYSDFRNMSHLFYKGKPRNLRLWDERWIAAKPVTISLDSVLALLTRYRSLNQALGDAIDAICRDAHIEGASFLTIPAAFKDFKLGHLSQGSDRDTVKALIELAGTTVRIVDSSYLGKVLCGASCPFPADIAPLFIFDAAARVTGGYSARQAIVCDIERQATIKSAYHNVRVRCWEQGASRSSLRNKATRERVVQGIVDTINDSVERFLIVHPMARESETYDLVAEITDRLDDPDRVSFIHWGDHHGTNAHRETPNVMLIGVWHRPTSAIVAEYMAMTGLAGDQIKEGDWDELGIGWLRENIMQAAGRASLRNVKGGVAGECNVYIITAATDKPMELAREVFPGGSVERWVPVESR